MRILITGVTGFAGGHLAEALLERGDDELFGTSRRGAWLPEWRHLEGKVTLRACDLCAGSAVEELLRDVRPERIFHLAGYANAGRSFQEADAAWSGNLTATRTLYEAIERWGGRPRILFVGSALIYGDAQAGPAFDEDAPFRPLNPYAASKAAADLVSYQCARAPGLEIVRVRPFNHIGPRQAPHYAVAQFARRIVAIERQRQPPVLETGNLSPLRDLTDVRDMVHAYLLLMERGQAGEAYNVATGEVHAMQEVLERLLALSTARVEVQPQAPLMRAVEIFALRGDASRLRRETGWVPRFSLDQTLADILNYWRSGE